MHKVATVFLLFSALSLVALAEGADTSTSGTDTVTANAGAANGTNTGTSQDTNPQKITLDKEMMQQSLRALGMLFVLAVLLENALAVVFNWRVFQTYFDSKGWKTIVMVGMAWAVVFGFKIDVLGALIDSYRGGAGSSPGLFSMLVTALILSGGSSGINNIFRALGYRNDLGKEDLSARPPMTEAWISIRVLKQAATAENVFVTIRPYTQSSTDTNKPLPIAGTIGGKLPTLKQLLFRDPNRFPRNGGYSVLPNTPYEIVVQSQDGKTKALDGKIYEFAPGAIVDFSVELPAQ